MVATGPTETQAEESLSALRLASSARRLPGHGAGAGGGGGGGMGGSSSLSTGGGAGGRGGVGGIGGGRKSIKRTVQNLEMTRREQLAAHLAKVKREARVAVTSSVARGSPSAMVRRGRTGGPSSAAAASRVARSLHAASYHTRGSVDSTGYTAGIHSDDDDDDDVESITSGSVASSTMSAGGGISTAHDRRGFRTPAGHTLRPSGRSMSGAAFFVGGGPATRGGKVGGGQSVQRKNSPSNELASAYGHAGIS